MIIRIVMENSNDELDLFLRIRTGINVFVNWMNQRWYKDDIACEDIEDGIVVTGDSKYENTIMDIIEDAKNGAYETV